MPLVQRLDPLLSPLFDAVSFPEERVSELRELAGAGTLVYVMRSAGALNYAYFAHAYARRELPVPQLVHGIGEGPLAQLSGIASGDARALVAAIGRGESPLIFLRRPGLFRSRHGAAPEEDPFPALVDLARGGRPIFLVPQVLVWERHPGKLKPGLGSLVVGSPDSPSSWRTAGAFLYNFRHAFAKVGSPIDLGRFTSEQGDLSTAIVARKVRGALWQHLAQETRSVVGPQLKTTDRVVEEVLRDKVLRATLDRLVAQGEGTPESLAADASKSLHEIAAAYSPTAVEVLKPTVDLVVNRIYDGIEIDEKGLERIQRAMAHSAVILCPSHKSHIDYLVLSKILYDAGMTPPHVAAGVNLSFFPLGALFRSGGAFFLRRTFKGDQVYAATFRAYVKRLMRDGFTQEFFIEGGRSRTGKVLAPKLGLLSMEVDAWLEGASGDVTFIPIAIDYEQIVEAGAYAHEAAGGEKKKENLGGLLRTPKVLTSRYGRIYLQVEEPVSLRSFFEERRVNRKAPTEPQLRGLVRALGHRIVYGIARAATITPAALLSAALLSHRRRGLSGAEIADRIAFLRHFCERTGARLSRVLEGAASDPGQPGPLREAAQLLVREGCLRELSTSGEIYFVADPDRRLQLSFYKNNLIHPLVPAALCATALLSFRERAPASKELRDRTLWLSRLFKHEFVYRVGTRFEMIYEETLELLREEGLVALTARRLSPASIAGRDRLELLRDLTRDFVESYFIAADSLDDLADGGLERKELTKRALARGQGAYLAGRVSGVESLSRPNFENAWTMFVELGLIAGDEKRFWLVGDRAEAVKLREEIAQYF